MTEQMVDDEPQSFLEEFSLPSIHQCLRDHRTKRLRGPLHKSELNAVQDGEDRGEGLDSSDLQDLSHLPIWSMAELDPDGHRCRVDNRTLTSVIPDMHALEAAR